MDAWEVLTGGSTIPAGDAWEHLEAQGGTGSNETVELIDSLSVSIPSQDYILDLTSDDISVEIDLKDSIVEIAEQIIHASIDEGTVLVESIKIEYKLEVDFGGNI